MHQNAVIRKILEYIPINHVPLASPYLSGVSLAAIVRDEIMNPAGGIIDFVESTVPYVEEAVIVDTGSVDGTRESLEELSGKYGNLRILDKKFDGFDLCRNFSLINVHTDKVLVLDADERLTYQDFNKLKKLIQEDKKDTAFNFQILNILYNGRKQIGTGEKTRLFSLNLNPYYKKPIWERLHIDINAEFSNVYIKHFMPTQNGCEYKNFYYAKMIREMEEGDIKSQPSADAHFGSWKEYNPHRERYGEFRKLIA